MRRMNVAFDNPTKGRDGPPPQQEALNAASRGEQLQKALRELQKDYPVIGDIRGMGLMVGVEFTRDGQPDQETAKALQQACLERNLLLLTCGTYENVIRWIPPLIVTEEQITDAVSIFRDALQQSARLGG